MGLPEEDFNSYATHRGDHLTAPSAPPSPTPSWSTKMVVDDGEKSGFLARVEPDGKGDADVGSHRDLHMDPQAALIIVACADYGQGSSRDWAAKGCALPGWR